VSSALLRLGASAGASRPVSPSIALQLSRVVGSLLTYLLMPYLSSRPAQASSLFSLGSLVQSQAGLTHHTDVSSQVNNFRSQLAHKILRKLLQMRRSRGLVVSVVVFVLAGQFGS
jgi:hypothetical protein